MDENKICELPVHWQAFVYCVVLCFEAWLGKTHATRYSSILSLLYGIVSWPFKKLFSNKGDNNGKTV